jgi:putative sigma-54 modulation protein
VVNWHDHVLTATSALSDMYMALSKSIDKLEKQALKFKNKIIDRKHNAKKAAAIAGNGSEVPAAKGEPRIISVRKSSSKPMTAEEALFKLNNQKDDFVVYRDSDTDKFSVLYKRKDGNFGLIQP